MRLNRRVPVGTHGGVRGRLSDYEDLLLDFTQTYDDLQGHGSRLEVILPCLVCFFKAHMIYIS